MGHFKHQGPLMASETLMFYVIKGSFGGLGGGQRGTTLGIFGCRGAFFEVVLLPRILSARLPSTICTLGPRWPGHCRCGRYIRCVNGRRRVSGLQVFRELC